MYNPYKTGLVAMDIIKINQPITTTSKVRCIENDGNDQKRASAKQT